MYLSNFFLYNFRFNDTQTHECGLVEDLKSSDAFRFKSLAGIQKGMGEANHNEGILMHVYMKGALYPGDPTSTLVSKLLCADSLSFLSTKASPLKRCEEMSTQGGLILNNNSFSAGITSLIVCLNWNVSFSVLLFFFQIIIAIVILIGVYILIIFEVCVPSFFFCFFPLLGIPEAMSIGTN